MYFLLEFVLLNWVYLVAGLLAVLLAVVAWKWNGVALSLRDIVPLAKEMANVIDAISDAVADTSPAGAGITSDEGKRILEAGKQLAEKVRHLFP